jgi:hypothetical protein
MISFHGLSSSTHSSIGNLSCDKLPLWIPCKYAVVEIDMKLSTFASFDVNLQKAVVVAHRTICRIRKCKHALKLTRVNEAWSMCEMAGINVS